MQGSSKSTKRKDKGKAKAAPPRDSDSDVEMIDPLPVVLDLTSPTPSPKTSPKKKEADAPEQGWAAEISDDMFDFSSPESPGRPPPRNPSPATRYSPNMSPTPETSAQRDSARESPAQGPAAGSSEAAPPHPTSNVYRIRAPAAVRTQPEAHLGEDIFWDIHSLDAIRVSSGLIDTHLNSLLWFQERLVEHHLNLVRTRNLAQKTLDGIARAMFIRNRMDNMEEAAQASEGGSS